MVENLLKKISNRTILLYMLLFFITLTLRIPTLFNDYYEADELAAICQTRDYIAGYIPGIDFAESKNFLYHEIFKFSYKLSYDYGYVIVHLITILIIWLTSIFIFLTGKKISAFRIGAIASILYVVMISSFNRQFIATNAEIIYNLFFASGIYFFTAFLDKGYGKLQKTIYFILVLLMSIGAVNIKFHGIMLSLFVLFFIAAYIPYRKWGLFSLYFKLLFSVIAGIVIGILAGYYLNNKPIVNLINNILGKIYYASAPGRNFSLFDFITRFVFRQGLLSIWHYILWIPASIYIWKFIKSKFKDTKLNEAVVLIFFICTYLMIFGGGARLYFHYFMAAYPSLAIVSALSIERSNNRLVLSIKKHMTLGILIPALFFLAWNTKDVIIKHIFPNAFYNESKILYWVRGGLVGTFNDYLLPHEDYKDAVDYIIKTTKDEDPVFVWGDGPYINYFANRRIGGNSLWMKNFAYGLRGLYADGSEESTKKAENNQLNLINTLVRKKPKLIVDVSENGLSNFKVNIKEAKLLYKFVKKYYYFDKKINGIDIYRRKR
ncbi:MAG: hypothetical protein FWH53_02225 [Leptospirales bacterium]|nr:hypothetical protein [Leptospirales bacterium]